MSAIKVNLDGLDGCAMQFHTIAITFEDLKSSMDHVFGSVDSKIKRRRNIDGSIADIQKSMKALYTEIENISLFVSSSKDIYDKTETHLEKESNSFIDRMEDIAGLKKEWYQENWFKIAVGTVVTGIAIAVVVVVGPELMFIAVGTVVGGGIYGITEGIESIRNGGEFIDGFSDGFMKGTIETFLAETVGCAGVGAGAKLFAGGTINSFSYTVSTQLNGGTVSAPDLAFEFAKGVGAIAAGEVIFAGIAKYAEKGLAKSVINEVRTIENPEIVGKEAKEVAEGAGNGGSKMSLLDDPKIAKDVVSDPDAVYGYRPKQGSSLDQFDIDWSNADEVAKAKAARLEYLEAMEAKKAKLSVEVDNYLTEGKNMREIAEMKVNQRNMDRINSYIERGDYDNLEKLYERNLLEYGQKKGPTVQQLYEKYGSYEDVIYSSVKVNKGMNVILGIEN